VLLDAVVMIGKMAPVPGESPSIASFRRIGLALGFATLLSPRPAANTRPEGPFRSLVQRLNCSERGVEIDDSERA
jgi:hypothetical protein